MDENQFMFVLQELSQMEETEVVPHCLKQLHTEGLDDQIVYLQKCLLEAAFIKLGKVHWYWFSDNKRDW